MEMKVQLLLSESIVRGGTTRAITEEWIRDGCIGSFEDFAPSREHPKVARELTRVSIHHDDRRQSVHRSVD